MLSTVSGWLLIISSGLVHDVYQRFLRPTAAEREIAWASYGMTLAVGVGVAIVAMHPPARLQLIVVFSSTGMAAAFLMPAILGCFWRRTTALGTIAAMTAGTVTTLGLYVLGKVGLKAFGLDGLLADTTMIGPESGIRPYYLLGFDPCIWGLLASLMAGVVVSLMTRPPDPGPRVSLDLQPPGARAGDPSSSTPSWEPRPPPDNAAGGRKKERSHGSDRDRRIDARVEHVRRDLDGPRCVRHGRTRGPARRSPRWGEAHHEVGGFLEAARSLGFEPVPTLMAWATPGRPARRRDLTRNWSTAFSPRSAMPVMSMPSCWHCTAQWLSKASTTPTAPPWPASAT